MLKIKLIDRNLIKAYGKILVIVDDSKAERFVRSGKAIYVDPNKKNKAMYGPPENKAVFSVPEDKTIHEIGSEYRYPDKDDTLFPHVIK
jgi:hypothetical protein